MKDAVLPPSRRADVAVAVHDRETVAVFERSAWPGGRRRRGDVEGLRDVGRVTPLRLRRRDHQWTDSLGSLASSAGEVCRVSARLGTSFTFDRASSDLYTRT